MTSRSIAVCDQSQLFREGLRSLLSHSCYSVTHAGNDLDDVLSNISDGERGIALIICGLDNDHELPGDFATVRQRAPADVKLVLLANTPSAGLVRLAAAANVHAVLSKNISSEVLQRALDFVLLGQRLFPAPHAEPAVAGRFDAAPLGCTPAPTDRARLVEQSVQLSEREAQILRCLVEGAPNKQIARDLGITEATVKVHIKGLLRKLRVNNRTQAAVWGLNNTLAIEPRPEPLLKVVNTIRPFSIAS